MTPEQKLAIAQHRVDSIAKAASRLIGVKATKPDPRGKEGHAWREQVETSLGPAIVETSLTITPDVFREALEVEVSTGVYSLGDLRLGWGVTYFLRSWDLDTIQKRLPRGAKQRFVEAISQAWQLAHSNAHHLEELAQRRQELHQQLQITS